jgi:hypothetical protein
MDDNQSPVKPDAEYEGITKYIDKNGKLLSALAAFAGLAIFTNKVSSELFSTTDHSIKWAIRLASFIFMTLALMVFLEMVRNFRDFRLIGRLRLFEELLFLAFMSVTFIWVKTYYPYLKFGVLMILVMAVITLVGIGGFAVLRHLIRKLISRSSFLSQQHSQVREVVIPTVGALIVMVCVLLVVVQVIHLPPR